jgi:hypothetical protein
MMEDLQKFNNIMVAVETWIGAIVLHVLKPADASVEPGTEQRIAEARGALVKAIIEAEDE